MTVEDSELVIESGEQNYGDSMARIDQPFDWAGRTGTLSFDTDLYQPKGAASGLSGGWTRLVVSSLPYSVVSYVGDNSAGQGPADGFDLQFNSTSGCPTLRVWREGIVSTASTPDAAGCTSSTAVKQGVMNHVAVSVSATTVAVALDGKQISRFNLSAPLPLTRGFVYLGAHNHATMKYENNPTRIERWDNVTFDGPVLPRLGAATASTFSGERCREFPPACNRPDCCCQRNTASKTPIRTSRTSSMADRLTK